MPIRAILPRTVSMAKLRWLWPTFRKVGQSHFLMATDTPCRTPRPHSEVRSRQRTIKKPDSRLAIGPLTCISWCGGGI